MGKKFGEDRRLRSGVEQVLMEIAIRGSRNIQPGSQRFEKMYRAILRAYMRVLTKIIMDTVLNGDRLFIGKKLMSFHLFDMPSYFRVFRLAYKYHHKIRGAYPVLKTAVHRSRIRAISISRATNPIAFLLNTGVSKRMSGMITHKIVNEGVKYSDNPSSTFIKENKLTNGSIHKSPGNTRRARN